MKYAVLTLALLLLLPAANAQIDLSQPWKFTTGDNPAYAGPDFDDGAWVAIQPTTHWETQGFPDYNGYCWFRFHFTLPAGLRSSSVLQDSVRILLGKIDDCDALYLNGQKIGQTGAFPEDPGGYQTAWQVSRRYALPADHPALRWDAENVLALRVYDGGGPGGFFDKREMTLAMIDLIDFIEMDAQRQPFAFMPNGDAQKPIFLTNRLREQVEGEVTFQVFKPKKPNDVWKYTIPVNLPANDTTEVLCYFKPDERARLTIQFKEKRSGRTRQDVQEVPYILTPPESPRPRIHNAGVYGARPGAPFLYAIAASGKRPIAYDAEGLPPGLRLDRHTGIISGKTDRRGMFNVRLKAANSLGSAEKTVNFIIGDNICLTPPLGWNSWNCWGLSVSDAKVRATADALIKSGLANYGWNYINIDDGWEAPTRDSLSGAIRCNEKFPDMKALSDYVHGLGLKLGIYSSPGPRTCGGYLGSWEHEEQDAQTWANWGIDYLKYDWCSYSEVTGKTEKEWTRADLRYPYDKMRAALDKTGRDIVYSLCQYGMGDVWTWGASAGGNLWRTTGDITDTWESLAGIGFDQDKCSPHAAPGHWNDPDMLIVGWVGWGENLHPTRLTPTEQYTHISLWALLSAPLLIGCDLNRIDAFTFNLLANHEVLAINQDEMGRQARRVLAKDDYQIWVKPLADGSTAVGIFNLGTEDRTITLQWEDLGIRGYDRIRDVWRQKDVGKFKKSHAVEVYGHGVQLLRIF